MEMCRRWSYLALSLVNLDVTLDRTAWLDDCGWGVAEREAICAVGAAGWPALQLLRGEVDSSDMRRCYREYRPM